MHLTETFEEALEWANFWVKRGWTDKVYVFRLRPGVWGMTYDEKIWWQWRDCRHTD